MTDLYIDLHHQDCKQDGKSTKIISINMETGDAMLECGCKVTIDLDRFTNVM